MLFTVAAFSVIWSFASAQPPLVPAVPPLWVRMPAAAQDGYVFDAKQTDSPLHQRSLIFSPQFQKNAFMVAGVGSQPLNSNIDPSPFDTNPQKYPAKVKETVWNVHENDVDLPPAKPAVEKTLDLDSFTKKRKPAVHEEWRAKEKGLNFKAPEFIVDDSHFNGELNFNSPVIASLSPDKPKPEVRRPLLPDLAKMLLTRQQGQKTIRTRHLNIDPTPKRQSRRRYQPVPKDRRVPQDSVGAAFSIPGLGLIDTSSFNLGANDDIEGSLPIDAVQVPERLSLEQTPIDGLANPQNPLLPLLPLSQSAASENNLAPNTINAATLAALQSGANVPFNPQGSPTSLLSRPPADLAFGSPYDPHKFKGGFGAGSGSGHTVLGTGYRDSQFGGFSMPDEGLKVDDVYTIPVFGIPIARGQRTVLNVKPKDGALSEWEWKNHEGFQTLGTGYKKGFEGHAGINGYSHYDRFSVPVLGWNVYQLNDGSAFDLSKFKFHDKAEHQVGPFTIADEHINFASPWLGQLVQSSIWDATLKQAGYLGVPGGVMPEGVAPGIPFIG